MGGKPRGGGRDLVVGQKLDDAAPFQIADDRAATMVAPEGPIVHANNAKRFGPGMRPAPNDAQQRVVADWQRKPGSERSTWPAAQRQAEVMDDPLHASGAARALRCRLPEALGKDPSSTTSLVASEPPCRQSKLDRMSAQGQVSDTPMVAAVNPMRETIAGRASRR